MYSVVPCDCLKLAEAITIGWLTDVDGCVQSAEQRPSATAECVNGVSNFAHCDCFKLAEDMRSLSVG